MAKILLAAGGTGGHLFPAEALARVLTARGHQVILATDGRGLQFGERFPAAQLFEVSSGTVRIPGLMNKIKGLFALGFGFVRALQLVFQQKPKLVVGFGGYPSVPPLLAAALFRVPVVLHEQNAVLGRANAFLARFARVLATGFMGVKKADGLKAPLVHVGNPVREVVVALRDVPYSLPNSDSPFEIVVFGGSQGARFTSDVIAPALCHLPEALRARMSVVQQARPEDLDRVRDLYETAGVKAQVAAFFIDLPEKISSAHLVVARSGASSVAELAALGRPSVLVPLPGSLDQDQLENAQQLAQAGGAVVVRQQDLTQSRFEAMLQEFMQNPSILQRMAEQARSFAVYDAAERLADLIEKNLSEQS